MENVVNLKLNEKSIIMKNIAQNKIFLFSFSLLLLSCKSDTNNFFDLGKLNDKIEQGIGIDISKLEIKMDVHLKSNPKYYEDAMNDLIVDSNSEIFNEYGLIQRKDNGDSLSRIDEAKYKKIMLTSMKESLILKECKEDDKDSVCIWKFRIAEWVDNEINVWNLDIDYFLVGQDFQRLYNLKYLSSDEYKFSVIYLHLLASIDALNNHRIEQYMEND